MNDKQGRKYFARQGFFPAHFVLGVAGLLAFLLLWKAAILFHWAKAGTMPDPVLLPRALYEELASGRLLPALFSSIQHYLWGLCQGSVLGIAYGILVAISPGLEASQRYLIRILRPIPPLAWVVFAIAWFQVSHAGAAFVISIGVFWINFFATYSAIKNIDPRYDELAKAFSRDSFWQKTVTITLPGAAAGILAGLRTGIGQAWMTLIAAELLGVPGMGQEMNSAAGVGAYEVVVIYMLAISLIYTICDLLFTLMEKNLLKWRPIIAVQQLVCGYRAAAPVIAGLDLAIAGGEFVTVVGPSGAGKSTLLRCLMGLIDYQGGAITLAVLPHHQMRRRAMVFQDARLLPWRKVSGNVRFGLKPLGLSRREEDIRIDEVLHLVQISELAHRWPHQLSGGQAQRVGIARALAVQPAILFMDEPFSAVDAITRNRLQDELLRIWRQSGTSVFFVTHDIAEATYLSDRVFLLAGDPANIMGEYRVAMPRERLRSAPDLLALNVRIARDLEESGQGRQDR